VKPAAGFCGTSDRAAGVGAHDDWSAWGDGALAHRQRRVRMVFLGAPSASTALRRKLGRPLDEAPDAVLAAAWERWSLDFVHHLEGPCVLALQAGDECLLYRDPSGLQSLYWHRAADGTLSFSTHLDTLLSRARIPRRLHRPALHEYLRFLDIAGPRTICEGVQAVEAGTLLRSVAGGPLEAVPLTEGADAAIAAMDFDAAVSRLDQLLGDGIATRLAGSTSPAAFLSSGIDSSLICAIARRHRPDTVALTVGFDGADFDESPTAARVAGHLGLRHQVLRFGQAELASAFERLAGTLEQPMADPATPVTVLAFEHALRHHDAVLDGTGADEALGAMPPRHQRLAVEYGARIPPALRRSLHRLLLGVPGLAGYARILDFEEAPEPLIRWHGFRRPEIEALCGEPVSFADTTFYRTFARFAPGAHLDRFTALTNAMPCDRLNQATLATAAAIRYPFWDRATERLLRQLRTDYRHLPGQPKRILRALLARYVPPSIWDGPKRGFTFPLHRFLAADDHLLVRRHLDPDRWRPRGWISAPGVGGIAQRFIAGDTTLTFRVWALVVLGAWLENNDELH
jgi:asparagine synthase (glutamine-hydrolysing)